MLLYFAEKFLKLSFVDHFCRVRFRVRACVATSLCVCVKECVAQCACRLTEGRLTPTAPPEEVTEALTQVLELLHTARHPHLHRDAREGSYTPAR